MLKGTLEEESCIDESRKDSFLMVGQEASAVRHPLSIGNHTHRIGDPF